MDYSVTGAWFVGGIIRSKVYSQVRRHQTFGLDDAFWRSSISQILGFSYVLVLIGFGHMFASYFPSVAKNPFRLWSLMNFIAIVGHKKITNGFRLA